MDNVTNHPWAVPPSKQPEQRNRESLQVALGQLFSRISLYLLFTGVGFAAFAKGRTKGSDFWQEHLSFLQSMPYALSALVFLFALTGLALAGRGRVAVLAAFLAVVSSIALLIVEPSFAQ
jgi:hypothetical protein